MIGTASLGPVGAPVVLPGVVAQVPELREAGVTATGLARRFGRRWALRHVDLRVEPGRLVMVVGRNGSGKSTLLRLIAGAIRPDRGRVLVDGHDACRDAEAVRRQTALLGHASNTYDALTALENLTVTARLTGTPTDRDALTSVLDRVELAAYRDESVAGFSAGMRRRMAFARLLLQTDAVAPRDRSHKASVVLLDEPYAQLDWPGFRFVDDLVRSLAARGMTLLMATHLVERGISLCDDGIVLEQGKLRWAGPAAWLGTRSGRELLDRPEGRD